MKHVKHCSISNDLYGGYDDAVRKDNVQEGEDIDEDRGKFNEEEENKVEEDEREHHENMLCCFDEQFCHRQQYPRILGY